jgi:hypothetical protein
MSVHTIGYGPRKAPNIVNAEITITALSELAQRLEPLAADSYIFLCAKEGRYPPYYVSKLHELNKPVAGCGGIQIISNREAIMEKEFQDLISGESSRVPDKYVLAHTVNTQAVHIMDISHGILFRRDTIGPDYSVYMAVTKGLGSDSLLLANYWARHGFNPVNLCIPVMNRFFMDAMRMVKASPLTARDVETVLERLHDMNLLSIKIE